MQKPSLKSYLTIALLLALAIGIMIHFQRVTDLLFDDSDNDHGRKLMVSFSHVAWEVLITVVVAFLMFALNFYILKPFDGQNKLKITTILFAGFLTVISVFFLNHLFFSFLNMIDPEPRSRGYQDEFIYRNFFVSGLVIGCVMIIRLNRLKQSVQLENETLRRESLQSQFESLKNQMSPHFLFNSLTALKTLINEDPETAQNYINNLSKALRYTLQSNERKLVTLKQEMDFIESYLYLIKLRFDTNLTIITDINNRYSEYNLPPLTIQTLLENAVKHNEISKRNPLTITIRTDENANIVISNNIQRKITQEEGTGIGLTNLSKQFQILLGREISISNENNEFTVMFPLLNT
jgi:sensor histidine kinase YesM